MLQDAATVLRRPRKTCTRPIGRGESTEAGESQMRLRFNELSISSMPHQHTDRVETGREMKSGRC